MILEIADNGNTMIKNCKYHYVLTDYPKIQTWEWNQFRQFICYQKARNQQVEVCCKNKAVLSAVMDEVDKLDGSEYIPTVEEAIEEFVYHATDIQAAVKILKIS